MNTIRRHCLPYSVLALAFLLTCGGCYNPKSDIESFRPQARQQLDRIDRVVKTVQAQPPLTRDTLAFADSKQLDFYGAPTFTENNATVVLLEELAGIGKSTFFGGFVKDDFYHYAVDLLEQGDKGRYDRTLKKPAISARFHQLLKMKYLVVLRPTSTVEPKVTDAGVFTGGERRGEAFLCELNEAATCHGGFLYAGRNSPQVEAQVSSGRGESRAQTDRQIALNEDLDKQTVAAIRQKIKATLPQATVASYW